MITKEAKTNYKPKLIVASMAVAAVLAASRPALWAKVYAADNLYDWVKQEDLDKLAGEYKSAAISADGSHLIIGVTNGGENQGLTSPLYVSADHGSTWENVADEIDPGMRNWWTGVDVSNDGQTMVAASNDRGAIDSYSPADGKIFISTDGGDTWSDAPTPSGVENWTGIVVSGDGSRIAAIDGDVNGLLHTSTDGGDTWDSVIVDNEVSAFWHLKSISISDNGDKILVGGENGQGDETKQYLSTNGGSSWGDISPNTPEYPWRSSEAISADGSKIVVSTSGYNSGYTDGVFVSSNDGVSWDEITPDQDNDSVWYSTAISDDGSTLSVLDENGDMYISKDLGDSWTVEDPGQDYEDTNTWRAVDFNEDGTEAVAISTENAYTVGDVVTPPEEPAPGTSAVNFTNAESSTAVQLTTPDGSTITCHSSVKESNLTVKDAGYSYPNGLVDFCFDTEQSSNEVSLTFVTDLTPSQVVARKYNPATNAYTTVSGVSITETTYQGKHALKLTYTIVDNGPLDLDPDLGEISDPIGLGAAAVSVPNTGFAKK